MKYLDQEKMAIKYYFANWKMYQSFASIKNFLKEYEKNSNWQSGFANKIIGIAASYEHLYYVQSFYKKTPFLLGAQDCSHFITGPYTGQFSIQSLVEMKASFCIVGHSEVRKFLGQSNELIVLKFKLLLAANISPIFSIGESLVQKNEGMTLQVLFDQLEPLLNFLQSYHGAVKIFIAYEPIYAIGTGIVPSENDLKKIFYFLNNLIKEVPVAKNVMFLYGGSVSAQTILQFQKIEEISGFLIGKASIDFQELKKIVEL
jgi:triosephosphate isomerase